MCSAYILKKDLLIGVLDRCLDDLYLGKTNLGTYRRDCLRNIGHHNVQDVDLNTKITGPALVVSDNVFISKRALKAFYGAAKKKTSTKTMVLVMPPSRQTELFSPLQDIPETKEGFIYDIFFIPAGVSGVLKDLTNIDTCETVVIPYREILLSQRIPHFILGASSPRMEVPLTSTVVLKVRHWLHVLRLAHLWPQIRLIENAQRNWWRTAWRLIWGFSLNPQKRRATYYDRFCDFEKGCHIHPTATVEASVVGKNVTIGAYANIVGTVLGDNVVIEDRANINYSVLGNDTFVSKNSTIVASVAFGPTDVCVNGIQYSLVDEACALTSWAKPLDASPHGPIRVLDNDNLREVGELPCGVAFAKNSYVGADVMIAPGRAIAGGQTLTRAKEDLILSSK